MTTAALSVDPGSPVPVFEQVRSQLAALIEAGSLAPGERLPAIRQLAADLGLAAGTVARVYRELEQAGLVASRVRSGTVVSPRSRWRGARPAVAPSVDPASASPFDDAADTLVAAAGRAGLDLDATLALVRTRWPA